MGENYQNLKNVIVIGLFDNRAKHLPELFENEVMYKTTHKMCNIDSNKVSSDLLTLVFIEIHKFTLGLNEL